MIVMPQFKLGEKVKTILIGNRDAIGTITAIHPREAGFIYNVRIYEDPA